MKRQLPDPLKQLRQKHVADAKLLAAQNRQREGIRKEQERIIEAEAAEKQANADRLKLPPPLKDPTSEDKLLDSTQLPESDPEILPEAEHTKDKVTTPEGDIADASLDYTLSEEGEGENISGNKELRNEADPEDESNS